MRCLILKGMYDNPLVRENQSPFKHAIWLIWYTRIFGEIIVVMQACTGEKKDKPIQIVVR